MKTKIKWFAAMWLLPLSLAAQAPAVITMDKEPHHHLALNNEYVKVFKVEVSPGDSIVLHRHDQDTIAVAIGDQEVTVGIPGKHRLVFVPLRAVTWNCDSVVALPIPTGVKFA